MVEPFAQPDHKPSSDEVVPSGVELITRNLLGAATALQSSQVAKVIGSALAGVTVTFKGNLTSAAPNDGSVVAISVFTDSDCLVVALTVA